MSVGDGCAVKIAAVAFQSVDIEGAAFEIAAQCSVLRTECLRKFADGGSLSVIGLDEPAAQFAQLPAVVGLPFLQASEKPPLMPEGPQKQTPRHKGQGPNGEPQIIDANRIASLCGEGTVRVRLRNSVVGNRGRGAGDGLRVGVRRSRAVGDRMRRANAEGGGRSVRWNGNYGNRFRKFPPPRLQRSPAAALEQVNRLRESARRMIITG